MKNTLNVLLALFCLFVAQAARAQGGMIETLATRAILVDAGTGTVLLDKNANERMPTSSMSKVMTIYMIFEALKQGKLHLNDEFLVSERSWRMQGSKMFIKVGDKVKVEDLIRGVIIQSGNDAAVTLAEGLAGSEDSFVDAMNARAKQIGLSESHFMNASGWPDPEHYSTPRDLALLAYRVIADFPEHYHYFSEKEFTYNNIRQQNRDPLLHRLAGADGLKTGHTEIAGYGLIGSARRGSGYQSRRLILVINGLPSVQAREDEAVRILEWGFRNFEPKTLITKGQTVDAAKVWLGRADDVPLVASQDMSALLPIEHLSEIKFTVTYMGPLKAPVKKDDSVAKLRIEIPGQPAVEMGLLAGVDVPRQGAIARAKTRLSYLLEGGY